MENLEVTNGVEKKDSIIDSTVQALDWLQTTIKTKTVDEWSNIENDKYTLSKEDFEQYFEWENFYQWKVWDCWLIAAIDSLVSYWDYERLIRTSVKKTDKWFSFSLPLWTMDDLSEKIFVSFDEIKECQRNIDWDQQFLVTWNLWIQALAIAVWKFESDTGHKFDYNILNGWASCIAFSIIAPLDLDKYAIMRALIVENEDPYWNVDKVFVEKLYTVLENFNTETDMLTLAVCQLKYMNIDRNYTYAALGHYSKVNHAISVEKVTKKDWTLIITLSNPWDSNMGYDITFENLIKSCGWFELCTKNKNYSSIMSSLKTGGLMQSQSVDRNQPLKYLHDEDKVKFGNFVVWVTDLPKSYTPYKRGIDNRPVSVNQVVKSTWVVNKELQKVRKDVIVSDENNKLKVSSYGLSINLEEKWWNIVISLWENKLSINKNRLSNKYEYDWKTIQKENYPLYLYWAKIANFINMMRKLYINTKSRDKKNNTPFTVKDWKLEFDDDPSKFSWKDRVRRRWAELIKRDDTITVLEDRSQLWISSLDNETQQKIANFLNRLVKNIK